MLLTTLKLTNFKNYEGQEFEFSPRLNCLTGLNGTGKTNVLDALYFLCICRSHLGLNDRNLVRHDADFFRVEGRFELVEDKIRIVAKYKSGERKEFERNGTLIERLSDHIGQFPVVMIAPDDVRLVQDGSEDRRRFLDGTLSQVFPEYLQNLLNYNALLKQRNALLKSFFEHRQFDPILLESIDRQMPEPALNIFTIRNKFVEEFKPVFQEYYSAISGQREEVDIEYQSDLSNEGLDSLLPKFLEKDRVLQRTTQGPHKDDIILLMNDLPVKKFASQGQLKSYLLALRLAQYEFLRKAIGKSPILLLDDIFDKLDENRVRQLLNLLVERNFGQVFITDTQRSRIESVVSSFSGEYKIFEVEGGKVV
ncbi:MAG: DNA replication/repair protein RecF [Lewinellaceae bacterium]|nr:DNA replication/repair protein RecF [Saprospiraceae bacterium]MCB9342195.1 DNA replication/repair protein RecF [Lewinellaceae bacterium]